MEGFIIKEYFIKKKEKFENTTTKVPSSLSVYDIITFFISLFSMILVLHCNKYACLGTKLWYVLGAGLFPYIYLFYYVINIFVLKNTCPND